MLQRLKSRLCCTVSWHHHDLSAKPPKQHRHEDCDADRSVVSSACNPAIGVAPPEQVKLVSQMACKAEQRPSFEWTATSKVGMSLRAVRAWHDAWDIQPVNLSEHERNSSWRRLGASDRRARRWTCESSATASVPGRGRWQGTGALVAQILRNAAAFL